MTSAAEALILLFAARARSVADLAEQALAARRETEAVGCVTSTEPALAEMAALVVALRCVAREEQGEQSHR